MLSDSDSLQEAQSCQLRVVCRNRVVVFFRNSFSIPIMTDDNRESFYLPWVMRLPSTDANSTEQEDDNTHQPLRCLVCWKPGKSGGGHVAG